MSQITASDHTAVLVRAADAEQIGFPPQMIRLLADSSSTGGMLSGTAQLLAGDRLLLAAEGDLAVVPPGLPHAFAAAGASDTDLLIVITPGVERFEYFRHLARIATGQQPPQSLLEVQARYDTFFDDSPAWRRARSSTPAGS